MQVKLQAVAVQRRHRGQRAPIRSGSICATTRTLPAMCCSVAISMAVALPPDLANTAATVIATAQKPAAKRQQAARPHRWHCVTAGPGGSAGEASSRRPPPDHPSAVAVNRDASLFLFLAASPRLAFQRRRRRNFWPASPDTGPSGRHASTAPAGFADSDGPLRAASGGGPVWRNRRRSRSARDRSSCTGRPRSRTMRTRTDGQTPGRSARHRRCGVDERRPRQDTRPACVLSGTVWGAAPGQNCPFSPAPC